MIPCLCPACRTYLRTGNAAAAGRSSGLSRSGAWHHLNARGLIGMDPANPLNDPALKASILAMVEGYLGDRLDAEATRPAPAPAAPAPKVRTSAAPAARVARGPLLVEVPRPLDGPLVYVSDLHAPFVHDAAFAAFCEYVEALRPAELMVAGDGVDFHSISRHDKDAFLKLQEELDGCRPYFDRLAALPATAKRYIMGNHCERIERLARENPALQDLDALDFGNVVGIPPDWSLYADQTHVRYGGDGGLIVLHGNVKAGGRDAVSGQQVARKMRDRLKHACIFGHFHRHDTAPPLIGHDGDPIWHGQAIGWMGDAATAAGYVRKPDWTVGFATVWFDESGFTVEPHVWERNRFLIRGRRYG